ncbi:assimilatory nitrate reductase electron transfer subunit [Actinopolyspora biskrensis]|uniref:Assimilatory nitrate reductase electron transfer subunit n=1 Tax=Actinopolyspora biskrensis TaxID=1470178 RepID=A0A852YWD2_9ACTN|nr:FAD-dependent oxidoreductase [Actinopolyspora biskrensis]NYH77869.1 assimilatory nitrate reductase electron transfer subunit [Actinopolyspora biskrensis]
MNRVVIIGHGPAGHRLAERLRARDGSARITVLGAREAGPYNPALFTRAMTAGLPLEWMALPGHDEDVRLRPARVTSIDRENRLVRTADGAHHPYDGLVLATGGSGHVPDLAGLRRADGALDERVRSPRSPHDCLGLRAALGPDTAVTVLGGGLLGVESAHALAAAGHQVTLVHRGTRLMPRELDSAAAEIVAARLRANGVTVRLGEIPVELSSGKLSLRGTEPVRTDALLLCTGTRPNTELAAAAGLDVAAGGIVVDESLRTSDPRVYALGDCARHPAVRRGTLDTTWNQADALAGILAPAPDSGYHHVEVTRARGSGLEVTCLGPPELLPDGTPGIEHVTFNDRGRHRYARLALHGERLAAATLVGLEEACAELTRLHETGAPVPSNRLGLLLGLERRAETGGPPVTDKVLCHCNNVSESTLTAAFHAGAGDVPALAAATRATTGCGSCTDSVRRLCESLSAAALPENSHERAFPAEEEDAA